MAKRESQRPADPGTDEVFNLLRTAFQRKIPSGQRIIRGATEAVLGDQGGDPAWIKANFSDLIEHIQTYAYKHYLNAEDEVGQQVMAEVFLPIITADTKADDALRLVFGHFKALDKFYLSLTQGRRTRAGSAFEYVIRDLFERLQYPFTRQALIDGTPDFLLPSIEHYRRHAADCIIFTAKRTLRERWRQIVTEGRRGLGFFLATIDGTVSARDLGEMNESRIYLVLPERLKRETDRYQDAPNVISFEHFFRFYLDPAMDRWRNAGLLG
jgi:hypothetical protein